MSKLVKQFKRELKTNPKKVGMLGLLVVVAAWFWGPLLMPKETPKPKPLVAHAAAGAAVPAPSSSASAAPASAAKWRWQDLDARLTADRRMKSISRTADEPVERNPFVAPIDEQDVDAEVDALIAEVLADAEEEKPVVITAPAYFDQRPLYLTSTIVGSRERRAVINGRAYVEGATMGTEAGRAIVLATVGSRHAVVEWNGHRRELKILRPGETATE